jgi:hypothetical protein
MLVCFVKTSVVRNSIYSKQLLSNYYFFETFWWKSVSESGHLKFPVTNFEKIFLLCQAGISLWTMTNCLAQDKIFFLSVFIPGKSEVSLSTFRDVGLKKEFGFSKADWRFY